MGRKLDETLAVLNGLVGDHLLRTRNGLATEMGFYAQGQPLTIERAALARALQQPTPRVVVLVHGVMCTESVFRFADGSDYGSLLARDLGYTPLYVRYNSGGPLAHNGAQLAKLLHALHTHYPRAIEEVALIGYSMGGLLLRRACRVAELESLPWLRRVNRAFYIGTPHLGAPAERIGRVIAKALRTIDDPYTRLFGEISDLRSRGIQDLGDAHLHDDEPVSSSAWPSVREPQHPLPLLPEITHHLIAGSLAQDPRIARFFGDSIVPLSSASLSLRGGEPFPAERLKVLPGLNHLKLANHADVYAQLHAWCAAGRSEAP
jgi:pimeloyl-ACP methyl ester carboxylesterase